MFKSRACSRIQGEDVYRFSHGHVAPSFSLKAISMSCLTCASICRTSLRPKIHCVLWGKGFEQSLRCGICLGSGVLGWFLSWRLLKATLHHLKVSWGHYLNFEKFPQMISVGSGTILGSHLGSPSKCHSKHCLFVGRCLSSLKWLLSFPNLHHMDEMRFPIPCHSRQGSAAMASSSSLCIFLVGRGETLMSIPWKGTFNIEATINIHQPWIINHGHVRNCFFKSCLIVF